jgi:acyl-coenzyme A synthetase/AMP-(fatty) acid ligase
MVGFAAALIRGQISLLPPADAPAILAAVAQDYPDLCLLTDTPAPASLQAYPQLAFPADLDDPCTIGVPHIADDQLALILFTSGSTGRPAPVLKNWGVLVRSALAAAARLNVSGARGGTIIGTVPHQHSYGLESMILLALQGPLAIDATAHFYPGDIRAAIDAAARPRLLVTTPVHLRALVEEPGGMPVADLILSATAPLSHALARAAETCFAGPLIEIYGCTEAGQIATRRTAHGAPWHCLPGISLDQPAAQSQAQSAGTTWADGPAVAGRVQLHDEITLEDHGHFQLGGRSADLVNVAGKRISLAHLNHVLLAIEGVTDGVFIMPDPDGGRRVIRLAALVVAPSLNRPDLWRTLRERIDAAFLPRPLLFVDALPRNALGKLPRATLLHILRNAAPRPTP